MDPIQIWSRGPSLDDVIFPAGLCVKNTGGVGEELAEGRRVDPPHSSAMRAGCSTPRLSASSTSAQGGIHINTYIPISSVADQKLFFSDPDPVGSSYRSFTNLAIFPEFFVYKVGMI